MIQGNEIVIRVVIFVFYLMFGFLTLYFTFDQDLHHRHLDKYFAINILIYDKVFLFIEDIQKLYYFTVFRNTVYLCGFISLVYFKKEIGNQLAKNKG
jgi:hypothetical protein